MAKSNYHQGNTVPRLTLNQLSQYLVNHNCVLDYSDDLTELAWRDAQRQIAISREIEAVRQFHGNRGRK